MLTFLLSNTRNPSFLGRCLIALQHQRAYHQRGSLHWWCGASGTYAPSRCHMHGEESTWDYICIGTGQNSPSPELAHATTVLLVMLAHPLIRLMLLRHSVMDASVPSQSTSARATGRFSNRTYTVHRHVFRKHSARTVHQQTHKPTMHTQACVCRCTVCRYDIMPFTPCVPGGKPSVKVLQLQYIGAGCAQRIAGYPYTIWHGVGCHTALGHGDGVSQQ